MSDELLNMLAAEADRRVPLIVAGIRAAAELGSLGTEGFESLRIEAHGLKGSALVVEQPRLSELAALIERRLIALAGRGAVTAADAEQIAGAAEALRAATHAVAEGAAEPPEFAAALSALAG